MNTNRKTRKDEKKKMVVQLQKERANRTDEEQIAKLDREGWKATKERARLNQRIEREQESQPKG